MLLPGPLPGGSEIPMCAQLVALQGEPHSRGCWGMGRGALLEEGALVLGLPPGSQPPAWEREGRRDRGRRGQVELRTTPQPKTEPSESPR